MSAITSTEPEWLDLLTHKSASNDPIELARQKFFVAARLAVGMSVLAFSPISLFLYGIPSPQHAAQFILALTPLIAIVVLKQTGNLRLAECVSIFGWAALAANVGASTQGYEAVSLTLLTIALLEAALTLEIGMVTAVVGAILALIALEVSRNPYGPTGVAARADVALFVTPLMMYMAALAAGAIFMAHARVLADQRNARDLRLLTSAIGDIVVRFDRTGAVSSIVGDTHKTYGLETSRPVWPRLLPARACRRPPRLSQARFGCDHRQRAGPRRAAPPYRRHRELRRAAISNRCSITSTRAPATSSRRRKTPKRSKRPCSAS